MPKRGLGRGLDALIPTNEEQRSSGGASELLVSQVARNPRQPRTRMDPQELADLAASIREHGVIQPIVVSQTDDPNRYILIAGERRLEATKLAGLALIPVIVRGPTSDQHLLELALIENIQRSDLTPLESALSYKHLTDDFGLSHEEVAKRVGKQRATVSNTIRLLKLPPKVQEALAAGLIAEGHARALLALPRSEMMIEAMNTLIGQQYNVRQAEELVRRMLGQRSTKIAKVRKPAEVTALESNLRESLGTQVSINRGRKGKGTIVIHFYSDDDLNTLSDKLIGE